MIYLSGCCEMASPLSGEEDLAVLTLGVWIFCLARGILYRCNLFDLELVGCP